MTLSSQDHQLRGVNSETHGQLVEMADEHALRAEKEKCPWGSVLKKCQQLLLLQRLGFLWADNRD